MLSSVSAPGLEKVAEAAPDALRIFQLYVRGDDAFVEDHVSRAIANGYTAFCLTVDTAHYSRRERDIAKRYVRESRARTSGGDFQKGLEWRTVKLIKDKYKIPLVIKGIATAEDAAIALDHGVEWIYVSNHGGRHSITAAVRCMCCPRSSRLLQAGPRSSSTVRSAAVPTSSRRSYRAPICRHRPHAMLGACGERRGGRFADAGTARDEVIRCLGLLGVTRFSELDKSYLHPAMPANPPHVFSAFPLLDIEPYRY